MKKIDTVMRKHFKKLEGMEKKAQAEALRAYDVLLSQAMGIILGYLADAYGQARAPQERLSANRSRHIMEGAQLVGLTAPRFDELHRLAIAEALRTELRIIQSRQAEKAADIIERSLRGQASDLWDAIAEHLSERVKLSDTDIRRLIQDEEYPLRETLQNNHQAVADKVSKRIWQAQARGEDVLPIVNEAAEYMRKTTREAFDIVEFYEATRIASAVALEFLARTEPDGFFRTVCIHDGKACKNCLKIEEEQAENPVPVELKAEGINAPPFHPFCRCYVSYI